MWFNALKTLLELVNRKQDLKEEKKLRLSEAFQKMADLVSKVINELENDVYPLGSCIAMEKLASDIMIVVSGLMDRAEADQLARELYVASKLELEYAMRKSKDTISTLQRVHGKLEALAIIYSV